MSEPDRKSRPFGAKRIFLAVGLILLIAAAVAAFRVGLLRQVRVLLRFPLVQVTAGVVKRVHKRIVLAKAVQAASDPLVVVLAPVV